MLIVAVLEERELTMSAQSDEEETRGSLPININTTMVMIMTIGSSAFVRVACLTNHWGNRSKIKSQCDFWTCLNWRDRSWSGFSWRDLIAVGLIDWPRIHTTSTRTPGSNRNPLLGFNFYFFSFCFCLGYLLISLVNEEGLVVVLGLGQCDGKRYRMGWLMDEISPLCHSMQIWRSTTGSTKKSCRSCYCCCCNIMILIWL